MRARPVSSRHLAVVQKANLDTRLVSNPTHETVKGGKCENKEPVPKTTDSWVAGHHPDTSLGQRDQSCVRAKAGCRMGSFASCVSATDNNDIEIKLFHVKHSLLSDAET